MSDEQTPMLKECRMCHVVKSVSEFYAKRKHTSDTQTYCKDCGKKRNSSYTKARYAGNEDYRKRHNAATLKYYHKRIAADPVYRERVRERNRLYYIQQVMNKQP